MAGTMSFHSAGDRSAAIRRILQQRSAGRHDRIRITITGGQVALDGTVDRYADKRAAVDAALLAGEAETVVDRVRVAPNSAARSVRPDPAR